jgi:UDP-3-O-[3-hydroxymyristoyl] N-acetylglucosamine deacetylase
VGRFEGELAGHHINNLLVRALMERPEAWRLRTFVDEIAVAV